MDKKIAGILGAVAALGAVNTAQATPAPAPTDVLKANSYADLLEPIPDALKVLYRLQSAGFKLNVSQIISAKVQDLTPEFIERARKHGFQNLDLNKLIQLRQLGILDSKADI